jgi:hypothetical protein
MTFSLGAIADRYSVEEHLRLGGESCVSDHMADISIDVHE